MACPFNRSYLIFFLLMTLILSGCVSLRFDRISRGTDVPLPSAELKEGTATLTDVLIHYGAPTEILDMNGKFALIYKKSFYQGGQLSVGIPLSDLLFPSTLRFEAAGTLMRHDLLALIFTPEGILSETMYERGASYPFWESFWK